jgi:dipeptidyl aminopeptidase/acylaminoacyl peptidase
MLPMLLRALCVAAPIGLVAGPCAAAPLEAFGKLPAIEQVAISPDGTRLAVVVTDGEKRGIAIQDLAKNAIVGGLQAGANKVRDVRWAGPNHVLVTVSRTGYINGVMSPREEWRTVIDYNVATRAQHQLLDDVVGTTGLRTVQDMPAVRWIGGKPFAFVQGVQFVDGEGVGSLFRVDLDAHRSMIKAEATSKTDQWLVDRAGEPLARTEYDAKSGVWVLKVARPSGWRVLKTIEGKIDHPAVLGLGRDGRAVLVSDVDGDKVAVREIAPGADDWGPPTLAQQDFGLIFDPGTDALIGTHELVGDADKYTFFSASDQAAWSAIVKAFPGQRVNLASVYEDPDDSATTAAMSEDHRKVVVVADSPTDGPGYFIVDLNTGKAQFGGPAYTGLKPADVSTVRPVAFKAADGLALSGYLTLPPGKDAKALPLIVFPHGGPAARDAPGFDWWAQAMSSRGYAVLQVNYRGSDGFGGDFLEAGYGQWGRKMQTDLSDGVRYLAAQGFVDPKRVCIVGASYGGYAALAGAALDPGVYRCAVDISGPSELKRFVAWSQDQNGETSQRYWSRFMGVDGKRDPRLEAISPADNADKVTIPILIIHGKDDTVVPFEQSQIMADALKRAGKSVDLVVLSHEDHWLSHGDTRLQMLQATMDFLAKNNPAD